MVRQVISLIIAVCLLFGGIYVGYQIGVKIHDYIHERMESTAHEKESVYQELEREWNGNYCDEPGSGGCKA